MTQLNLFCASEIQQSVMDHFTLVCVAVGMCVTAVGAGV